jgi:3D (Asp-Asp-Asp) domain-containing protein
LLALGTGVALASFVLNSALLPNAVHAAGGVAAKDGDGTERDAREGAAHARVVGTGPQGLLVRSGPNQQSPAPLTLREGTRVRLIQGPVLDQQGREWFLVTGYDRQGSRGWSAGEFLQETMGDDLDIAGMTVPGPGPAARVAASPGPAARSFTARMTAYTNQQPSGGAHGSMTRSGTPVRWGVVAVDPQVIPLGTRLAIEGLEGVFVAEDTGGGVKGNHVDVFFPDYASAVRFGVQYRTVTIVP